MKKILSAIIIISLFSGFFVFAQDTNIEISSDNAKTITAIIDCLSAAVASNISSTTVSLPSTTVSNDPDTLLPQRISFFLADPSVYLTVMSKTNSGNILSSLVKFMSHSISDPVLAKAYRPMSDRAYKRSDYLLNGYVNLTYPDNSNYESIREIWINRTPSKNSITLAINLKVNGNAVKEPVSIAGIFNVCINEEGILTVSSDAFTINETSYTEGIFYLWL